jgi:hypothetical protein
MPGIRAFEQQLAAVDALRDAPEKARAEGLQKALAQKNNFVAAKAADLIRELNIRDLTSDLLKAFDRFFEKAEKSDPQCWAKNAISRALAAFELQEPEVFLRGIRHIQLEPVWGGQSDTAGTLRATCALALVQCRGLTNDDLLRHLIDLLADKDKAVRVEVVRAIEQVGSPSASLLLRQRAIFGNDEPEVLGACYSGILHLEGITALRWISRFLAAADDSAAEAALAIAGTHTPEGFEALRAQLDSAQDPWFRSVLLSAIALTRQDGAIEFLLNVVRADSTDAEPAMEALLRSAPSPSLIENIQRLIVDNPRLNRAFSNFHSG